MSHSLREAPISGKEIRKYAPYVTIAMLGALAAGFVGRAIASDKPAEEYVIETYNNCFDISAVEFAADSEGEITIVPDEGSDTFLITAQAGGMQPGSSVFYGDCQSNTTSLETVCESTIPEIIEEIGIVSKVDAEYTPPVRGVSYSTAEVTQGKVVSVFGAEVPLPGYSTEQRNITSLYDTVAATCEIKSVQ